MTIKSLQDAIEENNAEMIRAYFEKLSEAAHKIAEAIYSK